MSAFTTPIPTGTDWTLLFKFHKTTVVLPVAPTDNFQDVRRKLFTALTSTPNLTDISGSVIPDSAEDVELAIPTDTGDVSSGWTQIAIEGGGEEEEASGKTSKGKGSAQLKNCPKGAGLKDGATIAFRFGNAAPGDEWPVKIPTFEEREDMLNKSVNGDVPGLAEAMAKTAGSR